MTVHTLIAADMIAASAAEGILVADMLPGGLPLDLRGEAAAALLAGDAVEYARTWDAAGLSTWYLVVPVAGRGGVSANAAPAQWSDCRGVEDLAARWAGDRMAA